ncbi:MAG TPA: VLRF1 family aeRF1-type release factor [Gaiellaceae bacterium]|nr:VLRF1 family aeRF1-type release factor [Gaiellaceae bacterium]
MISTMDASVAELARMHDEVGVLSIYVGIDPAAEASAEPEWRIRVDNDLRAIRARVVDEHDHGRRVAVEARLAALAPAVDRLADPTAPGRGRALFAGVASGEVRTVGLQAGLPSEATLGPLAHVTPLLRADDGHPRGLVLAGRDAVRVLEARAGRAEELAAYDVESVVWDHAEKKGPVASNPGRGQKSITQRERWDRHLEADHHRRLTAAAAGLRRLAAERGWELAVLAGDPRGTEPLREALAAAGVEVEPVERDLIDLEPAHALAHVSPALEAAAARRDLALVQHARDAAAAGGRGAAGLEDVLAALELGLVERLLLDGDREPAGAVTADGRLVAAGEGLPADPQFADRLVLRAVETAARPTVVGGAAAAALADAGGVAAILRAPVPMIQ